MSNSSDHILSRETRWRQGKAFREQIPWASHAKLTPARNPPDPIRLILEQDKGCFEHLLPIKYGRMSRSPFGFLRGSAALLAADLANTPVSGIETMLCGDAHLSNFGIFATPERKLMFHIKGFDGCYPGP